MAVEVASMGIACLSSLIISMYQMWTLRRNAKLDNIERETKKFAWMMKLPQRSRSAQEPGISEHCRRHCLNQENGG